MHGLQQFLRRQDVAGPVAFQIDPALHESRHRGQVKDDLGASQQIVNGIGT